MNVPAIRAAVERLKSENAIRHENDKSIASLDAVVRVGLRACDAITDYPVNAFDAARLGVIADILRESGVEVEG